MVSARRRDAGHPRLHSLVRAPDPVDLPAVPVDGLAGPGLRRGLPEARAAPPRRRETMSTPNKKTAPLSSSLRLICTDFDGTLAESENPPISPAFFERL